MSTEFYSNLLPSFILFLVFVFYLRILALLLKDSKRHICLSLFIYVHIVYMYTYIQRVLAWQKYIV